MPKIKMETETAIISMDVTADEWDLYDMPGREQVATEINQAIIAAFNANGRTERTVSEAALAVMRKYSDLGALDSEPMWRLENIMERLFGER